MREMVEGSLNATLGKVFDCECGEPYFSEGIMYKGQFGQVIKQYKFVQIFCYKTYSLMEQGPEGIRFKIVTFYDEEENAKAMSSSNACKNCGQNAKVKGVTQSEFTQWEP